MPKYERPSDERQEFVNCCKIFAVALFGFAAVRIALLPFEQGAFTPTNPELEGNATTLLHLDMTKQRVVLIAGSHESLQQNILQWTQTKSLLPQWSYPIPSSEDLASAQYWAPPSFRSFDPLFATIRGDPTYYEPGGKLNAKTKSSIVTLYKAEATRAWKAGKNVVIVGHGVNHLAKKDRSIEQFLKSLPEGVKMEEIQVVIVYPNLRFQQLLLLWKEHFTNLTLKDFVLNELPSHFIDLNPLGVAQKFAKLGMQTILIDSSGLDRDNIDLSSAIGCSILTIQCESSNTLKPKYKSDTVQSNGSVDLSDSNLKRIEKVLKDFDCGYYDNLSKPSNVHFLYREGLFASCSHSHRRYTVRDVVRKIQSIVTKP
jgi:hypothetical protein